MNYDHAQRLGQAPGADAPQEPLRVSLGSVVAGLERCHQVVTQLENGLHGPRPREVEPSPGIRTADPGLINARQLGAELAQLAGELETRLDRLANHL